MNGVNQAWVSYGYDWGNNQYQYRKSKFIQILNGIHANGGNSIRIWLHVEGQTSPKFDSQGYVTGLDNDGTLINELKEYLNIFVFITLWNGAAKGSTHYRLQGLLTDTRKLQSYINHALIPLVTALKYQPALGGYDIINEPEGEIIPDQNGNHCTDTHFLHNSGAGWAGKMYSAHDIQRFINWQAEAIRHNDGTTLVTVGSWNPKSNTDQHGGKNLYTDSCLRNAGGKHDNAASYYGLNKPLIIAEFNQVRGGGWTIDGMFLHAYNHGYAGAWSWHANADGSNTDSFTTQEKGMHALKGKTDTSRGGLVNFHI
ncbi:hypothetical protein KUTeg_008557 [Tegillarca granosa]|uniref:Uncharacterized protein n=1 Tax=Tegillarca granosa TaxID=220873 RepID=A0ABQ9FBM7_TEGGR|nr:hypothetical protein KUTeg_008557 [Tegillarca granosa]